MGRRKALTLAANFGKNLLAKRKEIGLTQDRLAAWLDIDRETISRFERGTTTPSLATLDELASKLGVTIAELLAEERPAHGDDAQIFAALTRTLAPEDKKFLMDFVRLYCERHG